MSNPMPTQNQYIKLSHKQENLIYYRCRHLRLDPDAISRERYGENVDKLSASQASELIQHLQKEERMGL